MCEVLGERVPEEEERSGEGPVPPGPALRPGERGDEVGVDRSEVAGRSACRRAAMKGMLN